MCEETRGIMIRFEWQCPTCGHTNWTMREFTSQYVSDFLAYCDNETGGCDRQHVLRADLKVEVQAYRIDFNNQLPARQDRPETVVDTE